MSPKVVWTKAIPRFLADREAICAHEHERYVTFPELAVGFFIIGGGHLFLKTAVTAWASGVLTKGCPECSGRAYVIYAGGNPLTGSGSWRGLCPKCGMVSNKESVTGMVVHVEIRGRWGKLGYQPVIQKSDPWVFNFKLGAVQSGMQREEILHFVPPWLVFMEQNYPDCLDGDGMTGCRP